MTARDGHVLDGANGDGESDEEGGYADDDDDEDMEKQALEEMGQGKKTKGKEINIGAKISRAELGIPALDEEQEYEWKWTPKMGVNRRIFYL